MTDLYQMVTDRIINSLETGVIPWHQPWCLIGSGAFNRVTRKPYSLLNQMCLIHDGEYASFDQWKALGGVIKKGEKAETVVFWKKLESDVDSSEEDSKSDTKPKFVLRYYKVFHISQVAGVSPLSTAEKEHQHIRIPKAEELISGYINREGITLEEEKGNEAYYSPAEDRIHIPALCQYKDISEYYSTLIHEMVHSTGNINRLNRPGLAKARFGSEDYSKEELIAEIGAASILNGLGIESDDSFANSVGYIENWLSKLRKDKYLIVRAASAAEKAAKFILDNNCFANAS